MIPDGTDAGALRPGPGEPASARVYDALLGGLDNYEADRRLAAELECLYPGIRRMAANNRVYLGHAVTWASGRQGIRQFLDLGSGFPGRGSVRDIAQAADPESRVACVDWDPAVARYGAKLEREGVKGVAVVRADIRDPGAVLADPAVTEVIDLAEPVALVFGLVLHHMSPAESGEVVAAYVKAAAPGSCAAITMARCDDAELVAGFARAYAIAHQNFTADEITGLFGGLEMLPPGVGPVAGSRPGWREARGNPPGTAYVAGGIGRKG